MSPFLKSLEPFQISRQLPWLFPQGYVPKPTTLVRHFLAKSTYSEGIWECPYPIARLSFDQCQDFYFRVFTIVVIGHAHKVHQALNFHSFSGSFPLDSQSIKDQAQKI